MYDPRADRGVGSLDLASAYLRSRGGGAAAWYVVAVTPLLAAGWWWIDAVVAQARRDLAPLSLLLAGAMLWRWAWLMALQARVMKDIGLDLAVSAPRAVAVLLIRLVAHAVMGWGGILILPGILGFYLSSFATPTLFTTTHPSAGRALRALVGLVWQNLGALWHHAAKTTLLFFLWLLSLVLVQSMVAFLVLPSLLGMDVTDWELAVAGPAWWFSLVFLGWVLFDFFWSVAAVFEWNRLVSQRNGRDLSLRLARLEAEA